MQCIYVGQDEKKPRDPFSGRQAIAKTDEKFHPEFRQPGFVQIVLNNKSKYIITLIFKNVGRRRSFAEYFCLHLRHMGQFLQDRTFSQSLKEKIRIKRKKFADRASQVEFPKISNVANFFQIFKRG